MILTITQELLRGAPENPLSSRHSPSYPQSGAVTQLPLVNNDNFSGQYCSPFFACWFSSLESGSGSNNSVVVITSSSLDHHGSPCWKRLFGGGLRLLNQHR